MPFGAASAADVLGDIAEILAAEVERLRTPAAARYKEASLEEALEVADGDDIDRSIAAPVLAAEVTRLRGVLREIGTLADRSNGLSKLPDVEARSACWRILQLALRAVGDMPPEGPTPPPGAPGSGTQFGGQ